MKALVTGASGFIGSNLSKKLLEQGFQVRTMILPGTPEWYLDGLDVEKVYADVTKPETLPPAAEGLDIVFHLAARASDWGPWDLFMKINAEGSRSMAEAAHKAGVKRFVQMSSVAVHRYRGIVGADETWPRDCFEFPYSVSKIKAENHVIEIAKITGMEVTIIRPGVFPFGPNDTTSFYPMARAMEMGGFGYVNSGRPRVSINYVENLAHGMILAATRPEGANQTFIIEDGVDPTWRELIEKFADRLGCRRPRLNMPYAVAYPVAWTMDTLFRMLRIKTAPPLTRYRIKVVAKDLVFNGQKARRLLGFSPEIGLDEGIERTVDAYKEYKKKKAMGVLK
jgi:nucleoside-diphosphate-sugar epimerase